VHRHRHEPGRQHPHHPGDPQDVPEAGDHADEGTSLRHHLRDVTGIDLARRRRNASCRLTITRAARSGMATENATTQILADRSSEGAVRNGCTMTTPMPTRPL
jgi:hypothetical protein